MGENMEESFKRMEKLRFGKGQNMVGCEDSGVGREAELQLGTGGKMNNMGKLWGGRILYAGLCLQKRGMQGGCELQGQGGELERGLNERMRDLGGSRAELAEDSVVSFSQGSSVSLVGCPLIIAPSP